MADGEFGEYLIIDKDLNRKNAYILLAAVGYELLPFWEVIAGVGMEFEESEDLPVFRLGTAYEFELGTGWLLAPGLFADVTEEHTSWGLSLGVGTRF